MTHIDRISEATDKALREKYEKGKIEHGGNLWEKPCLKFALDEVTDLVTYLHTAREQQEEAMKLLKEAVWKCTNLECEDLITAAYNILKYGNKNGEIFSD